MSGDRASKQMQRETDPGTEKFIMWINTAGREQGAQGARPGAGSPPRDPGLSQRREGAGPARRRAPALSSL